MNKFNKEVNQMKDPFEINPRTKFGAGVKKVKDLSFDEVFLDAQMEEGEILDDERLTLNYRAILGILLAIFLILGMRIYYLQVSKSQEYEVLAEGNKLRINYLLAPRGLILDKFGKVIASNIPSFELVVIPSDLPQDTAQLAASTKLASQIAGISEEELSLKLLSVNQKSLETLTIAENLPKEQALILISKALDLPGFVVQNNPIRQYNDPLVFSHLVGYTGKINRQELLDREGENYLFNDYIGKTGIENQYEKYLRGVAGKKQMEVNAVGNLKKTLAEVPALAGNTLKLNIDYDLQKVVYQSLSTMMKFSGAKKAAAVATEVATGKILALLSLPSFDGNLFAVGIKEKQYAALINDSNTPLINRVISGTYPPGSTVKPILAVAALTEGVVKPETKILDDGVIRVGNFSFYGYDRKGLGLMDVYSAIARSSDIYFYTIGGGNPKANFTPLGPERIANWFRKFHLGATLGIDLPNEKNGLVPDPSWKKQVKNEQWYLGDTYHVSIGQGDLLATPLQVNSWTATIANRGKIMRPFILDKVLDKDSKSIYELSPQILAENFLDEGFLKVVQNGMRQTVTSGSARSLATLPIEVAGKTGTAQFDARNPYRTHAWFTSYAPFSDPRLALTILVESGGEGSLVAVPVAKQVYEWWAEYRLNRK